jgi:Na+/H+-dicarboxylate symporter
MRDMNLLDFVTLVSAVGSALIAGSFFAFSTFVMSALGKIPPPQGIAAMLSINIVVINPWFMTPFVGTAVLCVVSDSSVRRACASPGFARSPSTCRRTRPAASTAPIRSQSPHRR